MQKKLFTVMMSFMLLLPFLSPFVIKAEGAMLEKELQTMVETGIIQGYGNGNYKPTQTVTQGEFATFIARALQLPEGDGVSSGSSLSYGVNAAVAANIVDASQEFHPEAFITRQDAALMIGNALNYLKVDDTYVASSFTDIAELSAAHQEAIHKSAALHIISGYDEHSFRPDERVNRAQAAAFIYRLLEATGTPFPAVASASARAKNPVYMKANSGLVYAKPPSASIVKLYSDPSFKHEKTYVSSSPRKGSSKYGTTELKYVTSTKQYVQVYIGGANYYMKPADALLVPFERAKDRSYYKNENGALFHYLYNYDAKNYGKYNAGVAPSFMSAGKKYYSWDGATFYNAQGNEIGTAYQYFQYLPARTTTNYTAAELDRYIMKVLAEKEAAGLKNATKKSKIIGLGATLKKVEEQKRVNALLILAMAMHESHFGMSDHALKNNNLFGLKVYDSAPSKGAKFKKPADCVVALVDDYLNNRKQGYLVPNTWRSYGSAPGTKASGINLKYASDAWWGAKVGGHMYRIDKALGRKDFGKYQLGQTNTEGLNVRATPNGSIQYQYKLKGMPVAYVGHPTTSEGTTWQKIISDDPRYEAGYAGANYLTTLPIAE
ncbi:S-layer homology domain-containing protein [Bacillus sp. REN10]|uniref:S-layer homology domain-containing protein n=1 Tax=Bacillus sp. REN10 TaxID=2782541 RepID=UPI00193C7E01|nr:S-layer homology domain-containing protein [Bacillus sp. REN10]